MSTPLSRGTLGAYGVLAFPLALLGIPLYVHLPAFYAAEVGVSLAAVGAVLLAARAFDFITDPLIGGLSDHIRAHGARRRVAIVTGVPVLALGLWFLFVPGATAGAGYLLAWSLVTYLGWTLVALPYQAWGAELSTDGHERTRVTAYREGWLITGTLVALALPGIVVALGGTTREGLRLLALAALVALPLATALAVLKVPEPVISSRRRPDWRQGLEILADNHPFRRLLAAWLLNGMANAIPATLFLLFGSDRIGTPEHAGILLAAYFIAGIAALPFWLALSSRIGKHRTWVASMLWACAVFAWVPVLGDGDYWGFFIICVLSGASLGCDTAIPASMQADVIDVDTAAGGGGRAGLYFGLWGMATKAALALAVGITFPLLEVAGFVPGGANSATALLVLALLYTALPVVLKLGAVALVWRFGEAQ